MVRIIPVPGNAGVLAAAALIFARSKRRCVRSSRTQAKTQRVLNQVKGGNGTYGYNAGTGEYGDMIDAGILDPAKVTRLALQNAASVAGCCSRRKS